MSMSFTNISGTANKYADVNMSSGAGRFTLNFWMKPTGIANLAAAITLRGTSTVNRVAVGLNGANNCVFIDTASTGFSTYFESTDFLIQGSWNMVTAIVNNNIDRRIYLNAIGFNDSQEQSGMTLTRMLTGAFFDNNVTTPQWEGELAEVALWSVVLNAADIQSLYVGLKPKSVRPASLRYYSPMINDFSNERPQTSITVNGVINPAVHVRRLG